MCLKASQLSLFFRLIQVSVPSYPIVETFQPRLFKLYEDDKVDLWISPFLQFYFQLSALLNSLSLPLTILISADITAQTHT
jgi:hypothetical protein